MKNNYNLQRIIYSSIFRYIPAMVLVLCLPALQVSGQQVLINSGAWMKNTGSAYIKIDNGSFINNGNYIKGTETVIFSGNATKIISGSSNIDMYNLSVTNTGGITTQLSLLTTNNLSIASDSKFTIDTTKAVTVNGTLTNSAGIAGLVLKSDITGTASLIHNTDDVSAAVELYISGNAEAWHFLSSPVKGQIISGSWLPSGSYGNGTGYDLYLWNEPDNCWIYKLDLDSIISWNSAHPGTDFAVGRGYLYSVQAANPTKVFAGNLNNGVLNYELTCNGTDLSLKGFNLVGNPYPSSIDWQASSGWTRDILAPGGSGNDMWIYNPEANNYGVINSATGTGTNGVTRYIAPMQGFFVRAAGTGNLLIDNSVRVHDGAGSWLKKGAASDINIIGITVNSEAGNGFDEVQLFFGSKQNEPGAVKLFSPVLSAPSLFLPVQGENYSLRYLTDTIDNPLVPVMFKSGTDGHFTMQFTSCLTEFETVILEDLKIHQFQNMKEASTYSYTSLKTDAENRFVLHFGPVKGHSEKELPARIYTDGIHLIIDLTLVGKESDVSVYNMIGKLLLKQKLQGETRHSLSLNESTQMLVVCLKNADGTLVKKILWAGN